MPRSTETHRSLHRIVREEPIGTPRRREILGRINRREMDEAEARALLAEREVAERA